MSRRLLFGGAFALWIAALSGLVAPVAAQPDKPTHAEVSSTAADHHDVSPPLRDIPPVARPQQRNIVVPWRKVPPFGTAAAGPQAAAPNSAPAIAAIPTLLSNFEGIG